MADRKMNARIQHKHDTEANWLKATNFIPLEGELIIYDADENNTSPRFKVGDGETVVSSLPFASAESNGSGGTIIDGKFAYFEEIEDTPEGSSAPLDADTLGGKQPSQYVLVEDIESNYIKASVEEFEYGETPMTKADQAEIANEAIHAQNADEAINSSKLENKTINDLFSMMFEVEHPVGSLYLSASDADDPNTKWAIYGINCVWELVKDVFLLGAGDVYELGDVGGEAEHTLTVDEMPSHIHGLAVYGGSVSAGGGIPYTEGNVWGQQKEREWSGYSDGMIANTGGNQAHNNMPPYLATNIWKRIS